MGYDMVQRQTHPHYAANKKVWEERRAELQERLKRLKDAGEGGSWLSEFEEQVLSDKEKSALTRDLIDTWLKRRREEDSQASASYETEGEAMLRAMTRPATEKFIAAKSELNKHIFSSPDHDPYFRLNIWRMSAFTGKMDALGMLKDTRGDDRFPESPEEIEDVIEGLDEAVYMAMGGDIDMNNEADILKAIEEGCTRVVWLECYGPESDAPMPRPTEEQIDLFVKYKQAIQNHLEARDPSTPGIDAIKFSSNDGWVVTREECASAVAVWDSLPQEERDRVVASEGDYWLSWIEYLRGGAVLDGFSVH